MSLDPIFWPQKVSDLPDKHRTFWRAYWARDLPALRTNYPELAHWDDRALIGAITSFHDTILEVSDIDMARNTRFLEWLHLSCQRGHRRDKDAFFKIEEM